ncbi:zinc finger protein, partial [Clarias magur]
MIKSKRKFRAQNGVANNITSHITNKQTNNLALLTRHDAPNREEVFGVCHLVQENGEMNGHWRPKTFILKLVLPDRQRQMANGVMLLPQSGPSADTVCA